MKDHQWKAQHNHHIWYFHSPYHYIGTCHVLVRWRMLKCPSTWWKRQYGVLHDMKMWWTTYLTHTKGNWCQQDWNHHILFQVWSTSHEPTHTLNWLKHFMGYRSHYDILSIIPKKHIIMFLKGWKKIILPRRSPYNNNSHKIWTHGPKMTKHVNSP